MRHRVSAWVLLPGLVLTIGLTTGQTGTGAQATGVVTVAATDNRDLRFWDARVDRMARAGELRLRRVQQDTLLPGLRHERFDQYYRGVRVFGADVARAASGGLTSSVFGVLYLDIAIATTPRLSADEVKSAIAAEQGATLLPRSEPELVVLPRDEGGGYVLAWRVRLFKDHDLRMRFVDAKTGAVVLEYSDLQTQTPAVGRGRGVLGDEKKVSAARQGSAYYANDLLRPPELVTFDLRGDWRRTNAIIGRETEASLNDVATDADNSWANPAAVDAHVYLGWTYDYLYKRMNRPGLDGRNTPIHAIVHPARRDLAEYYYYYEPDVFAAFILNAGWYPDAGPDGMGIMVFGEGLPPGLTLGGEYFDFFSGALDIAAHELIHGVTDYSSRLIYRNESGALNESFSDVISTGVEYYFQRTGNGLGEADYLQGEDIVRVGQTGAPKGIRSLSNPGVFGDPDHYSKRYLGTDDNGGVHTNSGISNHAFYLAIEGGVNRTSGVAVQGVGPGNREQIEKIFFDAFVFRLPSSATFAVARRATIEAARELYGGGSAAERAVTQAWTAVGVN